MSVASGPDIPDDGLVFSYDMGNPRKSWIGRPTTNSVNAATTALSRYNNPGFSGTVTNTGQTYKGMPIYELTFVPQDSTFISRLSSGEGFGCFHNMGIPLQANTRYMASIYVKSDHPLQVSASEGYSNGYSNISGWNQNGTTSTRYQEDGWTRLYTQYLNNFNGYSTRTNAFQVNFTVNTTSTQTVDVNFTVPANGSNISDFATLHAIIGANPAIVSNGGLTGLSIVNHGLNTTDFQKLAWPSTVRLKSSDLPFNYFVRLSVPSTGGVNTTVSLRANFDGYYTALTDSKYWKLTFDTTGVAVGQVLKTYWCCPMIEQHDTIYPSTFVNGARSNTQAIVDLTNNNTITANSLTYYTDGTFSFNGSTDYISHVIPATYSNYTISLWIKLNSLSGDQRWFSNANNGTFTVRYSSGWSFHFNPLAGTPPSTSTSGTSVALTGVWYNVVAVNDSTDASTGAKLYVNGTLIGTAIPAVALQSTGERIGSREGTTSFGNGQCGAISVYNRALSAAEVWKNFVALRGRFGI